MNVEREEDRQKNNCPSRGLGLAAAAIGVGVGAALYYFFSKSPENPGGEGSTTSGWSCEQPHALNDSSDGHEDSYITISEHSTTDTSINDDDDDYDSESTSEESDDETDSDSTESETGYTTLSIVSNVDSDDTDWDITSSSIGVPEEMRSPVSPMMVLFGNIGTLVSPRPARRLFRRTTEEEQMAILRDQALYEEEQLKILREQAFRERTWSLEECSICFDIILKDQQVTTLPCTHHFHSACIAPWLQEQQTCPNCRKAAE